MLTYAFFKSKNVELIKNYKNWYNLNYEICYFFNVYGRNHIREGKYATVIAIFEKQYSLNQDISVVLPGDQARDFTHIDDICSGIMKVSQMNKNKEYHLRYGKNYSIIQVAKAFSEKVKFLPERKGERFTSEDFESDTETVLNWKANIDLFDYIKQYKMSHEQCK